MIEFYLQMCLPDLNLQKQNYWNTTCLTKFAYEQNIQLDEMNYSFLAKK